MTPNPGSPEAVAQGCCCPIADNARGEGMKWDLPFGGTLHWVNGDCRLHGVAATEPEGT